MSDDVMLTTSDNPFNPFTQFNEWHAWDYPRYDTLGYLARIAKTSHELSQPDQMLAIVSAVDEIVSLNSGLYLKLTKPSSSDTSTTS